jgi:hypothetical protein
VFLSASFDWPNPRIHVTLSQRLIGHTTTDPCSVVIGKAQARSFAQRRQQHGVSVNSEVTNRYPSPVNNDTTHYPTSVSWPSLVLHERRPHRHLPPRANPSNSPTSKHGFCDWYSRYGYERTERGGTALGGTRRRESDRGTATLLQPVDWYV